ncbi:hypothetical protein [Embleya sp. AB8]|uniref:hypothetical protein n=1 Tax=Embleya sp. AB8 TaxID=3156304 RepID=UPI003C726EC3
MTDAQEATGGEDALALREMSATLWRWKLEPWPEIAETARSAGPIMQDRLVANRLWESLPASEQAAVHWAMTSGHELAGLTEARLDYEREGVSIRRLADHLRHVADLCDGWKHGKRAKDARYAEEIGRSLAALPDGWRGEAVRRIMTGEDVPSTLADATRGINILRNVYGIDTGKP